MFESNEITIVDYGAGNLQSILNMMRALGLKAVVASDPAAIAKAGRLVLPGVGNFDYGMENLLIRGLAASLHRRVIDEKVPILGICLGAQLMTRGSEEGTRPGLGWIAADTRRFDVAEMSSCIRIPHMGWADTWAERDSPLSVGMAPDARFYYVHSYHIVCDTPKSSVLAAQHGLPFTAGVQKDNVLGVQFHPEKSHSFGMQLLRAFAIWNPAIEGECS